MKYGTYGSEDLTACDLKSPVTLRCPRCFQSGHKECKSQSSRYEMPGRRPRHHVDHERPTKGLFISPEASRPPLRPPSTVSAIGAQIAVSTASRAPSLALLSMFARWRPGDLTCVGISAPFSDPDPVLLQYYSHTRRQHRLCFICKTKPLNAAVHRAYVVLRTSRRVAIV
jgi:hypothetical protein